MSEITEHAVDLTIERFLEGWLNANGLMLCRTEANGQLTFYSSSRAFSSQAIDMVITHAGKYAEDDSQQLIPIDLRRSTEYCVI